MPRPQIQTHALSLDRVLQRGRVRGDKILDVDIVTDACSVGRRIIVAVDADIGSLTQGALQCQRNQMRFWRMILTERAIERGSSRVEVSQYDAANSIGLRVVVDGALDD